MKKLFIPIGFCFLITASVSAQEKQEFNRKQKVQHEKKEIKKELNLSEDQQNKLKTINQKFRDETKALKSNDNITRGDFKKQMSDLNAKRKAEVEATLTPEQKTKMKEVRERKQTEIKEKSAERFEKMSSKLQLDDNQKATLLEQRKNNEAQIKAIRDNQSLTDIQKREQIKAIKEKQKAAIKSILTDEQKQKLETKKNKDGKAK